MVLSRRLGRVDLRSVEEDGDGFEVAAQTGARGEMMPVDKTAGGEGRLVELTT